MFLNTMFFKLLLWSIASMAIGVGADNADFKGCYQESASNSSAGSRVAAPYKRNCMTKCRESHNRYALIRSLDPEQCSCSNQYVDGNDDSQPCVTACKTCRRESAVLWDVYETGFEGLSILLDIEVVNITDTMATTLWTTSPSLISIEKYVLQLDVVHTFAATPLGTTIFEFSNNTFKADLRLHPGTRYNLSLHAESQVHSRESVTTSVVFETQIGVPSNIPHNPKIIQQEPTTMTIEIHPVKNNNGPITAYRILAIKENNPALQLVNLMSYTEAMKYGLLYYIAADVPPEIANKPFVVGDGKYYGTYYNAPLERNVKYRLMVGVVSTLNQTTKVVYSNSSTLFSGFIDATTQRINYFENNRKKEPHVIAVPNPPPDGESQVLSITLSICVAILCLILVILMAGFYLHIRKMANRRQRLRDAHELKIRGPITEVENSGYIPEEEVIPVNYYENLKQRVWSIPKGIIKFEDNFLGTGKYGRVNRGTLLRENNMLAVAIYSIRDRRLDKENKTAMLKDLDVLIRTGKHDNILGLIGTNESVDAVFVILEYVSRNLKDLLLGSRETFKSKFCGMQESETLKIAVGVARGMKHLASLNIIHKQLCARNVSITDDFVPKINDYGLMQYYNPKRTPDYTRWTASEVFKHNQYHIKSDVWSFGCLLWEICAIGGTPYGTVPNNDIPDQVTKGLRLHKLRYVSDPLYEIMINCWQQDLDERPTFENLIFSLSEILDDKTMNHLAFNLFEGFQYEEFYPDMELAARRMYT